ncbi:MAG: ABC transporter ATP-binding protein, partial [Oscillospiraceae bacterium]|nr:ABC transporter ATP-binding protein [Oscillospiraceae bacterium]
MKGSSSAALRRVLKYIQRRWPLLALSILLAAASVAGTLYVHILIGDAIDCIVGPGEVDFPTIAALLGRIAAVAAATAIMQWIMSDLNNRITFGVVRDVRRDAFDKLQILPLSYLDAHPSGELVSRIIADADQFADGLLMGFTQLFTGVVTILGTLFFMLRIHWVIALVVVVLTPLSLFAAKFIAGKTYSMFQLQSSTRGEQTAHMDEMIVNQKVVQAFSHEQQSLEKFDEINGRLEHAALRATFFSSLTNPVTRFVNSIVYAAVGLTGALAA